MISPSSAWTSSPSRHLRGHLVAEREVHGFFNHTVIGRGLLGQNRTFINAGVPVSRVAAAAHTEIRRLQIRDASGPDRRPLRSGRARRPQPDRLRPNLPTSTHPTAFAGQGIRPEPHRASLPPVGSGPWLRARCPAASSSATSVGTLPSHQAGAIPVFRTQSGRRPHSGAAAATCESPAARCLLPQNNVRCDAGAGTTELGGGFPHPAGDACSEPGRSKTRACSVRTTSFYPGREQHTFAQPAANAPPPAIRTSAWTPPAQPREEERPAPMPEIRTAPAPRVEMRQAPAPANSAPARALRLGSEFERPTESLNCPSSGRPSKAARSSRNQAFVAEVAKPRRLQPPDESAHAHCRLHAARPAFQSKLFPSFSPFFRRLALAHFADGHHAAAIQADGRAPEPGSTRADAPSAAGAPPLSRVLGGYSWAWTPRFGAAVTG